MTREPRGIEEAIQKAMEEGAFDNLRGAGKPLPTYNNPFEDPTMRMANRIMKENDILPEWIEERKSIQAALEEIRGKLARAWQEYQNQRRNPLLPFKTWEQVATPWHERLVALNRRIFDFNLKAPTLSVQLAQVDIDGEIKKAQQTGG